MKNEKNLPFLLVHIKAYISLDDTKKIIEAVVKQCQSQFLPCFGVPFSYIEVLSHEYKDVIVGAETILDVAEESFTGSIAGKLLKAVGARFVILKSPSINKKITTALDSEISPIVCIADQDENEKLTKEKIHQELSEAFSGLSKEQLQQVNVLYDAGWIYRSLATASDKDLQQAYLTFREAASDFIEPKNLIFAVPTYSVELLKIIENFNGAHLSIGTIENDLSFFSQSFLKDFEKEEMSPKEQVLAPEISLPPPEE